jgi:hypothetical protein
MSPNEVAGQLDQFHDLFYNIGYHRQCLLAAASYLSKMQKAVLELQQAQQTLRECRHRLLTLMRASDNGPEVKFAANWLSDQESGMREQDTLELLRGARDALKQSDSNQARALADQALEKAAEWIGDYERSFDLRWKASQRAIEQWQQSHPGNEHVWPDHQDLCVWLMEQFMGLKDKIARATELLEHLRKTQSYPPCCYNDFEDKVQAWLR